MGAGWGGGRGAPLNSGPTDCPAHPGTFYARERVAALYAFVREALQSDWLPFELLASGGQRLSEEESPAFDECGLVSEGAARGRVSGCPGGTNELQRWAAGGPGVRGGGRALGFKSHLPAYVPPSSPGLSPGPCCGTGLMAGTVDSSRSEPEGAGSRL